MRQSNMVCGTESRRKKVHEGMWNGLDYLEVSEDQLVLTVYFLGRAPADIKKENVLIEGGSRIRNIYVKDDLVISRHYPEFDDHMEITVSEPGDFSVYTLKLVEAENGKPVPDRPLKNFDPRYASLDFCFKAGCPSNLDCKLDNSILIPERSQPEIDYLARDYAGFRQLILDRLSLILPDWKERHVPDLGIALVEILAYMGDHLSYYQDAVATESYLDTSRQRISVRRHVRLVDYAMHEGCNSRTWVFLETNADLPSGSEDIYLQSLYFISRLPGDQQNVGILAEDNLRAVPSSSYQIFEPVMDRDCSLRPEEIDSHSMALSLNNEADPLSGYLKRQLSADTRNMLDSYKGLGMSPEQLQSALAKDLNRVTKSYSLYDPNLFSKVKLRSITKDLLGKDLRTHDLVRLNRLLLEDYYGRKIDPNEMALMLIHAADPLLEYLKRHLSEDVQKMLDSYKRPGPSVEELQIALANDLNRLMKSYSIYDPALFLGVALRSITKEFLDKDLKPHDLVRLNRLLLEDKYETKIDRKGTLRIFKAHNRILLHTWGNKECCLARGATRATLKDWEPEQPSRESPDVSASARASTESQIEPEYVQEKCPPQPEPQAPKPRARILKLKPGDLLLFEEAKGPITGEPEDANPHHRHVVRLTGVRLAEDLVMNEPVMEVEWSTEDALPFSLCISALQKPPSCRIIENISFARGNLLLVDHGGREEEPLGTVQTRKIERVCLAENLLDEVAVEPEVFSAQLKRAPLTFSQPIEPGLPAARMLKQDPRKALPCINLYAKPYKGLSAEESGGSGSEDVNREVEWSPVPDLLGSSSLDRHFVVEMDEDGFAHLRFGDGELGRMPEAGMQFGAIYRLGNGPEGNVGRDMISHIVFRGKLYSGIDIKPRNPLPASGGTAQEKIDDVKLIAPYAFRKELRRAIMADDYALLAKVPGVQRAAAALRWTGSWHEAMVAVDPLGGAEADERILDEVGSSLYPYRRMGHDLAVKPAHYVALDIELTVCVLPNYLRGHIEAELLELFSNRIMADGKPGLFHPDNLTFGDGIYLSRLVAAAQAVPGVESVIVNKLQRLFEKPNHELENGLLPLGPYEIARLDNDPSFPENGVLILNILGGR